MKKKSYICGLKFSTRVLVNPIYKSLKTNKMMTKNKKLIDWVNEWAAWCTPTNVQWCDGSKEENQRLLDGMVARDRKSVV